jgi:carboxyl-terminal processing protease
MQSPKFHLNPTLSDINDRLPPPSTLLMPGIKMNPDWDVDAGLGRDFTGCRVAFIICFMTRGYWIAFWFSGMAWAQGLPPGGPVDPDPDDAFQQMQVLTHAMEVLRQHYVDPEKVTYEKLVEGALHGMLRQLDPHCEFMSQQLFEDLQREQTDSSEGIGITVALRQGRLVIVSVRDRSPAAEAGLLGQDQIVRIDGILTDSVGVTEAVQLLKGEVGTAVRLTVRRPGTQQFLDFEVLRQTLQDSSVHQAMLLHPKLSGEFTLGYVRISQFSQGTAGDLAEALDGLEAGGMQALILDLRNNPGGLLESAVAVCGEFLPEGTVVVTTEGPVMAENPPPLRTPKRQGRPERNYPMAILINHASASAAEIVAAALQDLKRALLVGSTSFGKGSVQTIMPLSTGSALRLTTAKYFTPGQRSIHEHGVEPNLISATSTEQEMAMHRWRMSPSSGEAAVLELAELDDPPLARAADAMKSILLYRQFQTEPVSKDENSTEQDP